MAIFEIVFAVHTMHEFLDLIKSDGKKKSVNNSQNTSFENTTLQIQVIFKFSSSLLGVRLGNLKKTCNII